jgi:hypothetical protein
LGKKLKEKNILVPKQLMVYFGKFISALHDKEIKDCLLGDNT